MLVHEATNAFIPSQDQGLVEQLQRATGVPTPPKGQSYPAPSEAIIQMASEAVLAKTLEHGHSTPEMAGKFATDVAAQVLVLTHFSARYKGDESEESVALMQEIASKATASGFERPVYTARDFWCLEIPVKKDPVQRVTAADDKVLAAASLEVATHSTKNFAKRALEVRSIEAVQAVMQQSRELKLHAHVR